MIRGTIAAAANRIRSFCDRSSVLNRTPGDGKCRLIVAYAIMVLAVLPAMAVLAAAGAVFYVPAYLAARRRRNRGRGCRCYLCDMTRVPGVVSIHDRRDVHRGAGA